MEYRRLGNSGLEVSAIGLGTNNFGGMFGSMYEPEACAVVVNRALDLGINMIDTSNSYTAGNADHDANARAEPYSEAGLRSQRSRARSIRPRSLRRSQISGCPRT